MDGKEKIIAAILEEAAAYAREVTEKADSEYALAVKSADEKTAELLARENEALSVEREEALNRRKIVADLDSKKVVLSARSEAVDKVFSRVLDNLCALDKSAYKSFIVRLIEENAHDGQTVVLSKDSPVTARELSLEECVKSKNLTVKDGGAFRGGVVIETKVCDLNLSFEAIVTSAKEKFQTEIAAELFGE